jgi:hypothetical protein
MALARTFAPALASALLLSLEGRALAQQPPYAAPPPYAPAWGYRPPAYPPPWARPLPAEPAEPPPSGTAVLITGIVFVATGALHLGTLTLFEDETAAFSGVLGGTLFAAGVPMIIVGAVQRSRHVEWWERRLSPWRVGVGAGGVLSTWTTAF